MSKEYDMAAKHACDLAYDLYSRLLSEQTGTKILRSRPKQVVDMICQAARELKYTASLMEERTRSVPSEHE